jgi:hypothetical protein
MVHNDLTRVMDSTSAKQDLVGDLADGPLNCQTKLLAICEAWGNPPFVNPRMRWTGRIHASIARSLAPRYAALFTSFCALS